MTEGLGKVALASRLVPSGSAGRSNCDPSMEKPAKLFRAEQVSQYFVTLSVDSLTVLLDRLVHRHARFKFAQIRRGSPLQRQRRMCHKHHIVHIFGPLIHIEWSELISDSQSGVAFDSCAVEVQFGKGAVSGLVPVEEVQSDGVDPHWKSDGQFECRLNSEDYRVWTRLHDSCVDENKFGIVDNSLRNGGKNHQEAILVSKAALLKRAENEQDWEDDGEENDREENVATPEPGPMATDGLFLRSLSLLQR